MTHSLYDSKLKTTLTIDETKCENTLINIENSDGISTHHYLTPKELETFIGALLHVQSKKRRSNGRG